MVGVSTAAGPVLGGLIIAAGGEHLGWRLCFLVNVPVGIAAFALCRAWLPDAPRSATVRSLDLPGAALLALGVAGLLFPAVEYDADHEPRLALIVIPALAVLAGFIWWERGPGRRRGHPLIDLALFKIRSFAERREPWPCSSSAPTPARRWCWRCSCRTGWASRPCTRA